MVQEKSEKRTSSREERGPRRENPEKQGLAKPNRQGLTPYIDIRLPEKKRSETRSEKPTPKRVTIREPEEEDDEPIPLVDKRAPAFARRAPIEDPTAIDAVEKALLDLELPLAVRAIASISPEVRDILKKLFTKRRIPREELEKMPEGSKRVMTYIESIHPDEFDKFSSVLGWVEDEEITSQNVLQFDPLYEGDLPAPGLFVAHDHDELPDGALVMTDPVELYYNELAEDEKPRPIIVSKRKSRVALHLSRH